MSEILKDVDVIKLGTDYVKGCVDTYSVEKAGEALRNALLAANGGTANIDYRRYRDGECKGLFSIVETIIKNTVYDELLESDFFMNLVEYRNVKDGDQEKFLIDDDTLFTVDKIADGTQAIRRQRIQGMKSVTVETSVHAARIYEELRRVLAGRVNFDDMIKKLSRSFKRDILNEIYATFTGAASGSNVFRVTNSTYTESDLLNLIDKVEAAAGGEKTAIIFGTKQALRGITVVGDNAKNMVDADGYVGKFYGCDVVAIPQRFKSGTTTFMFANDVINVVACSDKPIKFVTEGNPLIIPRDPAENMDLTMEYFCAERYGVGLAIAGGNAFGTYDYN